MKSKKLPYLLFFFFILCTIFRSYSQIDSSYIRSYPHKFSVKVFANNKFTSILHEYDVNENTYVPNRPLGIGLGFTAGKMGMSFSYGFDFLRNNKKGKTESIDIQYHNYGRKFIFDVIGQQYKGFYNDNAEEEIHSTLKTLKIGFFGQYVFNNSRFSYSSAYNQKEKQHKSAGSLLVGGGIYFSQIHSDIPHFFNDSTVKKQSNFQLGPNVGYVYNWIISPHFYISASVSAGVNIGFNDHMKNPSFYPSAIPRFAMGYDDNTWSLSMSYVNNLTYNFYTDNRKIALSSGGLQLTFTKRFSSFRRN